MIYTLKTVIKFGKYKGSTIQEIIDDDPGYINWAIDEIEDFELDEEANDYLVDNIMPTFMKYGDDWYDLNQYDIGDM